MEKTEYLLNLIYLGGSLLLLYFVLPRKEKGWARNVLVASCVCLLLGVATFLAIGFLQLDGEATWWAVHIEKVAKGLGLTGLFVLAITRNLRPKANDE